MTNEEAKSELEAIYMSLSEEKKKALDVAFKAMEQEPCNELPTVAIPQNNNGCENCRWQSQSESEMPCKQCMHNYTDEWEMEKPTDTITMEQEPKTGHWKRISIDKYSEHAKYWYRCDRCGKDNLGNTDWCPNCGVKMIEPQERSENVT